MQMSIVQDVRPSDLGGRRLGLGNAAVACAATTAEALFIVAAAVLSGIGYHAAVYGEIGSTAAYAGFGFLTAVLYAAPFLVQGDRPIRDFLTGGRTMRRIALRWHVAFLLIALIGFLTKTTDVVSRGWIAIFFLAGLFGLLRLEVVLQRFFRQALDQGHVRPRRLMLVGSDQDLARYRTKSSLAGSHDVIVSVLRLFPEQLADGVAGRNALLAALHDAGQGARAQAVDDILLLPSARRADVLNSCLDSFSLLPVNIHLDAFSDIELVGAPKVEPVGAIAALTLSAVPSRPVATLAKRAFDIATSAVALVLLAPLFAVVAALIKLDSPGPVFFRQRRRGYNHHEFSIYKFRSMSTLDDGDRIEQARRNDPRVTRIGAFLRRWSIDELPQLINVLKGEMSIVGPRPHAVAHDRYFETRIDRYARRLNVKPGITGWAQVNGFRGETDTIEKMSGRVAHDLHYIDNWSLPFDLYIIALTVTSPRAFSNAF
jgi:Undecaprenyl-phosphate glucose phosphotransferase